MLDFMYHLIADDIETIEMLDKRHDFGLSADF